MTVPPSQTITQFKKGSTFNPQCTMEASGSLPNLIGVTVTSSVKTSNNITHNAVVTIPNPSVLAFSVRIDDSLDFGIGLAQWDIKFVKDGIVFYTETIQLNIVKNITP